ncbi:hypothetical protein KC730_00525 [Candidatus Kaiserbacteria bacterium]|nr:hypothetical protein [Candidatus Kaiserbacteria bacterium]
MSDVLEKFVRATNYLSAAQIYLQDNVLLTEPLSADHIKSRLLGHWGTCPGINFTYAHMNRAIIAIFWVEAQEFELSFSSSYAWVKKDCWNMELALQLTFD